MSEDNHTKEVKLSPSEVGRLVNERVSKLQGEITSPTSHSSEARAALACLRNAIKREPGSVWQIWKWTSCPINASAPDIPTAAEKAVHTAMCLYAIHQQSRSEKVHIPGRSLSQAVRQLAGEDDELNSPVRKRFARVITATSLNECLNHLIGLIGQFRTAEKLITLDYGMLADDLHLLQLPGGSSRVRLKWSRDYYQKRDLAMTAEKESN